MDVSASVVKELREKTGAGMMDCKKALTETAGDVQKAGDYLRQKGLAAATRSAETRRRQRGARGGRRGVRSRRGKTGRARGDQLRNRLCCPHDGVSSPVKRHCDAGSGSEPPLCTA